MTDQVSLSFKSRCTSWRMTSSNSTTERLSHLSTCYSDYQIWGHNFLINCIQLRCDEFGLLRWHDIIGLRWVYRYTRLQWHQLQWHSMISNLISNLFIAISLKSKLSIYSPYRDRSSLCQWVYISLVLKTWRVSESGLANRGQLLNYRIPSIPLELVISLAYNILKPPFGRGHCYAMINTNSTCHAWTVFWRYTFTRVLPARDKYHVYMV